jgi:hypothetical protein
MTTRAIPLPPAASASSAAGFALDAADTPYTALVALVDGEEALLLWRGDAPPTTVKLRPLGIPIAVTNGVALERATSGHLWACVVSMVPGDAGKRQPWLLDLTALGVAPVASGGDGPQTLPAPPGATVDPSAVLQAIAGVRGPADGKDADFNSVAGVKNTGEATYDLVKRQTEAILTRMAAAGGGAIDADALVNRLLFRPPTRDYGLPHELEPFVNTDFQQYLCATVIALGEYLGRLAEWPKANGTSILRT